jgi:two-component system LytT family sensor kinase
MTLAGFILSPDQRQRRTRHAAFWAVYATYFYLQSISPDCVKGLEPSEVFQFAFHSLYSFLPACIFCVYASLYVLYPMFLRTRRYLTFAFSFLVLFLLSVAFNYLASTLFFWVSCHCDPASIPFMRKFALGLLNSENAIIAGGLALGIKLTRTWFLQRRENLLLIQQRTKARLGMIRVKLHPDYLVGSLGSIREHLLTRQPDSPAMIIHLSDLLSYWLYESDEELVSVEKELSVIQKFMLLEKSRQNPPLSMELRAEAPAKDSYIVPMLLLPITQAVYEIAAEEKGDHRFLQIMITTSGHRLCFRLKASAPITWSRQDTTLEETIKNITSRLGLCEKGLSTLNVEDNGNSVTVMIEVPIHFRPSAIPDSRPVIHQPTPTVYEHPSITQ